MYACTKTLANAASLRCTFEPSTICVRKNNINFPKYLGCICGDWYVEAIKIQLILYEQIHAIQTTNSSSVFMYYFIIIKSKRHMFSWHFLVWKVWIGQLIANSSSGKLFFNLVVLSNCYIDIYTQIWPTKYWERKRGDPRVKYVPIYIFLATQTLIGIKKKMFQTSSDEVFIMLSRKVNPLDEYPNLYNLEEPWINYYRKKKHADLF